MPTWTSRDASSRSMIRANGEAWLSGSPLEIVVEVGVGVEMEDRRPARAQRRCRRRSDRSPYGRRRGTAARRRRGPPAAAASRIRSTSAALSSSGKIAGILETSRPLAAAFGGHIANDRSASAARIAAGAAAAPRRNEEWLSVGKPDQPHAASWSSRIAHRHPSCMSRAAAPAAPPHVIRERAICRARRAGPERAR